MTAAAPDTAASYPGARRPDRRRTVTSAGVALAAYEWGDPQAPPVFAAHGGLDFAATWDLLAPLLVDAGWRVVSWDQRGHGDSQRTALASWDADIRDAVAVMASTTDAPAPVIGHSKGGGLLMQLAEARPQLVSHFVNLDGLPSKRRMPDVPDHLRTRMLIGELEGWLDHRRRTADAVRPPGTPEELARRRQRQNPRLPLAWLRYLVTIGARQDPDGWRWKLDPSLRPGGFGPFRPEWSLYRMAGLGMPFVGVLGLDIEEMSWGTEPADVEPWLPLGGRLVTLADTGHFVHIERPHEVAGIVLDLIGPPGHRTRRTRRTGAGRP